jgi:hypothetical protein
LNTRLPVEGFIPGTILLEGAVDTLGRRYTMEEARYRLRELGVTVVSPALGGQAGGSHTAVLRISDGFDGTAVAVAAAIPLVVLAERETEAVRRSLDRRALVTNDFATALYFAVWEAMRASNKVSVLGRFCQKPG